MTTGNKIMWKRGEIRSNFSSFPHYFIYIFLTSGVQLHIHSLYVVVQFIVFLTLSTLICRGTDISKYFSESLGIRDNESRLYVIFIAIRGCSCPWSTQSSGLSWKFTSQSTLSRSCQFGHIYLRFSRAVFIHYAVNQTCARTFASNL